MTREQLDAIRARVEAATPGPWQVIATAGFIASAREDVSALLAEVERLRAELDTVGEALAATSIKCDYAFSRGVAAMREAAAKYFDERAARLHAAGDAITATAYSPNAQIIRALPDPEDKS